MDQQLTHYQKQIVTFFERHRRMPGYQELMSLTGFKSKNAVYKLINKLVAGGVLMKDERGKITLSQTADEVPLLGLVTAGFPAPGEEQVLDTLDLGHYLVKNQSASYLLRVTGDSMIDAGIHDGDLVLVEKGRSPQVGDIVIAEVDGEVTMKYYRRRGEQAYLEPANKKYRPIYPVADLKVEAVVRAVIRRYDR